MRVSPEVALLAVVDRWRAGHVKGLGAWRVSAAEARALGRPPMGSVHAQLREGIAHTGHTKAAQPVVSDRSLAAELDVSGDTTVLVAGAIRRVDNEEPGYEMNW